jgi:adenosylcobinamide amidohydrolase
MFDEMFPDDVYDFKEVYSRWMVIASAGGFKIVDTVWENELKAEYSDRDAAEEVCKVLNRYDGKHD